MEDLRETGQLEQDAQTIIALWDYKPSSRKDQDVFSKPVAQEPVPFLKVLKNRNGKSGITLPLNFDGATNRIETKMRLA